MSVNGTIAENNSKLNLELKEVEREKKKLEKELLRKEKALAEAVALLILSKKAEAFWERVSEDE